MGEILFNLVNNNDKDFDTLYPFYMATWQLYEEDKIKAMSHRTFLEIGKLLSVDNNKDRRQALKDVLKMTYWMNSEAVLNPVARVQYNQLVEEVI